VLADRSDRFSVQRDFQPAGIPDQSGHSGGCSQLLIVLLFERSGINRISIRVN
jgi:hypothetical protein